MRKHESCAVRTTLCCTRSVGSELLLGAAMRMVTLRGDGSARAATIAASSDVTAPFGSTEMVCVVTGAHTLAPATSSASSADTRSSARRGAIPRSRSSTSSCTDGRDARSRCVLERRY